MIDSKICILIRVDSNKVLGLGHLNRCLVISKKLKEKNVKCIFISKYFDTIKQIKENNFQGFFLKKSQNEEKYLKKLILKFNANGIIFDSKRGKNLELAKKLSKNIKIILIDSLKGEKYADLIILPGMKEQFTKIPKIAKSGKKFVIINSKFKNLKMRKKDQIIISFGGSDKFHITQKIVNELMKHNFSTKIIIVLGVYSTQINKIESLVSKDDRFEIQQNPKNYPELLASSKLGIISFGISVYEVAFMRLPTFVISHSNENDRAAKKIKKYGWFEYCGKFDEINYKKLIRKILDAKNDQKILNKMKIKAQIIDNRGSSRIANVIINLIS